jgi:hypothetical protein
MGLYTGNVALVFSNQPVDVILHQLELFYALSVECIQFVNPEQPWPGEIRVAGNTLIHVDLPKPQPNDLYATEQVRHSLDLEALGFAQEGFDRADLVLVQLFDDTRMQSYYYPYRNALYTDPEE